MKIKFPGELLDYLDQGLEIFFSIKDQIGNLLDVAGHTVSFAAVYLCHYSVKTAKENLPTNGCSCVPIKLYL